VSDRFRNDRGSHGWRQDLGPMARLWSNGTGDPTTIPLFIRHVSHDTYAPTNVVDCGAASHRQGELNEEGAE